MASSVSFFKQPQVKAYGLPILLVLAGLAILGLLAWPTFGKIQEVREDITDTNEEIALLKQKVEDLLNFADQQTLLDEKFTAFERAITLESKIPNLLTKVQEIAESCQMEVKTLQYSGEGDDSAGTGRVRPIRIRFSGEGTFSSLTCLTSGLESSSRVVDVESFQYRSSRSESGVLRISPELILLGYYTPQPVLVPTSPITLSFTAPAFLQAEVILETLK